MQKAEGRARDLKTQLSAMLQANQTSEALQVRSLGKGIFGHSRRKIRSPCWPGGCVCVLFFSQCQVQTER